MIESSSCARCPYDAKERGCKVPNGKMPSWCPTLNHIQTIKEANLEYVSSVNIYNFAYNASKQEAECYIASEFNPQKNSPSKSRIQEIIEFCKKQNYTTIGLAFCIGLREEAAKLNKILESNGLRVISVSCKTGCTDKSYIGISAEEKIIHADEHESMCNPIAQALILNKENTQFNLVLGLCVGHDSLFIKYSEAPVTIVAVKDRLLGHNPLAALSSSYYKYLVK